MGDIGHCCGSNFGKCGVFSAVCSYAGADSYTRRSVFGKAVQRLGELAAEKNMSRRISPMAHNEGSNKYYIRGVNRWNKGLPAYKYIIVLIS